MFIIFRGLVQHFDVLHLYLQCKVTIFRIIQKKTYFEVLWLQLLGLVQLVFSPRRGKTLQNDTFACVF